ncbi:MAG: hypothetical protein V4653_20130 [Pseudomonadota bacterium]
MRNTLALVLLFAAAPASAQFTMPAMPGAQPQTPEQRRAFCQRVGTAAVSCGLTTGAQALTACLVRTLPTQDSLRVARVANDTRGDATAIIRECGVGAR